MFGSGFSLRASAVVQSVRDVRCFGQGSYIGPLLGFSLRGAVGCLGQGSYFRASAVGVGPTERCGMCLG